MTDQDKIEALARMEGWGNLHQEVWDCDLGAELCGHHPETRELMPVNFARKYLTSHDALQPLLEKMTDEEWLRFGNLILGQTGFHNRWFHPKPILLMTPEQKADCIIKAVGAWKD